MKKNLFIIILTFFYSSISYAETNNQGNFYFSIGFNSTSKKSNNLDIISNNYFASQKNNHFALGSSFVIGYNWNPYFSTEFNYTPLGKNSRSQKTNDNSDLIHVHEYSLWSHILLVNFVIKAPITNFFIPFVKLGVGYVITDYSDIEYDIKNVQNWLYTNSSIYPNCIYCNNYNNINNLNIANKVTNASPSTGSMVYNITVGAQFKVKDRHSLYLAYNVAYAENDLRKNSLIQSFELGYRFDFK